MVSTRLLFQRFLNSKRFTGSELPREILDKVTDRPAILRRFDSHAAWVNSKALEIAQIPKDIELRYGKVDYDSQGNATGSQSLSKIN